MLSVLSLVWLAGLLTVALLRTKGAATPFILTLAFLTPTALGYANLDAAGDGGPTLWYLGGLAAMVAGYALFPAARTPRPIAYVGSVAPAVVLLLILAGLSIYHFLIVGIPALSSDVELTRFDVSASGVFGIPSRAYLFGLPILTLVCMFTWKHAYGARSRTLLLVISLTFLCTTRLASGFKGALIEVLTVVFVAASTIGSGLTIGRGVVRFAAPALMALAFAVILAPSYGTYAGLTTGQTIAALSTRATILAAEPGHLAIQQSLALHGVVGNSLLNDAAYYMFRYWGVGPGASLSFTQIAAATIYQLPLSASAYLVPVAVGAVGQMVFDFGPVAFLLLSLVGFIFAYAERRALNATSLTGYAFWATLVLALIDYVTKGNPIYVLINWGFEIFVVVLVLDLAGRLQGGKLARGREFTTTFTGAPGRQESSRLQ